MKRTQMTNPGKTSW